MPSSRTSAGLARRNAALNGYRGVQFPWQSGTTGVEEIADVLPTFRVAAAGRVRVRQFVYEDQARLARQRGVEVELAQLRARTDRQLVELISARLIAYQRPLYQVLALDPPRPSLGAPMSIGHILQLAKTGSAEEWSQLNQPAYGNPAALRIITDWVAKRFR